MKSSKLLDLLGVVNPMDALDFNPMVVLLQNGDLILTELAVIDAANYCMLAPFRLFESQSPVGEVRMAAVKLIPGSDDMFYHLSASSLISAGEMNPQMFQFYEKNVDRVIRDELQAIKPVDPTPEPEEIKREGNVYQFPTKTIH